jgi:twitching motility protein PilT
MGASQELVTARATEALVRILKGAIAAGSSDIHLRADKPPVVRLQGQLRPLDHPELSGRFVEACRGSLAQFANVSPDRMTRIQGDFACEIEGVGRFRVHFYRATGEMALALRVIPSPVPDFATLRIPPSVKRLAEVERGLVLVTGATGNGKSTTIAALLEMVNKDKSKHVITIEDPIEFPFVDHMSTFSQRELGRDVESFHQGLVGAMREDPDWIFVSEIRRLDEFEIALTAAEAGHVVLSTLHSADAARAITRMIHMTPEGHQDATRQRLSDALAGIVCQRLVPRRGTRDRVLLTEVLMRTPTVQDCIRDPSRFRALHQALEQGTSEYGTHSFDQQLLQYVKEGLVSTETARAVATNPNDLLRAINLSGAGGRSTRRR